MRQLSFLLTGLTSLVLVSPFTIALENPRDRDFNPTVVKSKELGVLGLGSEDAEGALFIYENTLPKIVKVSVKERFFMDPYTPGMVSQCERRANRPTEDDVREYFSLAWEISATGALKDLNIYPCYAKGTLTLADGSIGAWTLSVSGAGYLQLFDGRAGNFYCAKCSNLFTLDDLDEKTLKKFGRDPKAGDTFKE